MGFWSRFKRTIRDDGRREEIREEIDFHLDMDRRSGTDPRSARLRLGNARRVREDTRAAGVQAWLESILQDIRYGIRQLQNAPGLSMAVVASLAIGLGANTAIFSLVDAAVLRPLPVQDPETLVQLEWRNPAMPAGFRGMECLRERRATDGLQLPCFPEPLFRAFARSQTEFASIIGAGGAGEVTVATAPGEPAQQVRGLYVSANFFPELGIPIRGRSFTDDDDGPGALPAIIVSHRFWSGRMRADPEAVGRSVRVNDVPAQVVGVAPPGFFGVSVGEWVDVYAPLAGRREFEPISPPFLFPEVWPEATVGWVNLLARVGPGRPGASAATAMTPLLGELVAETTGAEPETTLELVARPASRGFFTGRDEVSRALWILMLLVGVLLTVVAVNVANLLLSRSIRRRRESAVRLALGAGRLRLVRQHLIESGIVAGIGGVCGLGLGALLAHSIHAVFQTGQGSGSAFALPTDWRLLAYAAFVSVVAMMIFGLAPAWAAARSAVNGVLKSQSRSVVGGGLRLGKVLVSTQFAMSFVALVAAGLLGRSLENLYSTELGIDPDGLVYATVRPLQAGYTPDRTAPYLERVQLELAAIPGVVSVAAVANRPLEGGNPTMSINAINGPPKYLDGLANPAAMATWIRGGPGFMETLGIRLLAGRALEATDAGSPFGPGLVRVVVDERFAEVFFPGQSAVGQRFGVFDDREILTHEVVGLAANTRLTGVREAGLPTIYEIGGAGNAEPTHFAIRVENDPTGLASAVQQTLNRVDATVPLAEFHTQSDLIDRFLRTERLLALVSGAFGLAALVLVAVGLAGLLAYAVARRTNEIGIRMALGATGRDVRRMVLRDSIGMVGAGVLTGIPAAWAVGRYLESFLFEMTPMDPVTVSLALVALVVIAAGAAIIPARRAASVDPLQALREE